MRTRKEIEDSILAKPKEDRWGIGAGAAVELLLDIRDLLANPPIEISCEDVTTSNT